MLNELRKFFATRFALVVFIVIILSSIIGLLQFYNTLESVYIAKFVKSGRSFEQYLAIFGNLTFEDTVHVNPLYNPVGVWPCQILMLISTGYYLTSKYKYGVVGTEIIYQNKLKRTLYEVSTILAINMFIIMTYAILNLLFGYISLYAYDIQTLPLEGQEFINYFSREFRVDIYFLSNIHPIQYLFGVVWNVQLIVWLIVKLTEDSFYGLLTFIVFWELNNLVSKLYLFENKTALNYLSIDRFRERVDINYPKEIMSTYNELINSSFMIVIYLGALFCGILTALSLIKYYVRGTRV